jgi:hypothetical protein
MPDIGKQWLKVFPCIQSLNEWTVFNYVPKVPNDFRQNRPATMHACMHSKHLPIYKRLENSLTFWFEEQPTNHQTSTKQGEVREKETYLHKLEVFLEVALVVIFQSLQQSFPRRTISFQPPPKRRSNETSI